MWRNTNTNICYSNNIRILFEYQNIRSPLGFVWSELAFFRWCSAVRIYVWNILAVMPSLCLPSRCRNVSVGRLLVWPDFALLESLLVSTRPAPCSPLTPSDRSRSSAPEPEISCRASSGRASEAVPSRRTQLPPVNTRSSQRHQSGVLRCCAFFSAWNYFPPRTPGFPLFVVTTLSRPGKGLQDGNQTCFNIYFSSNFQSRFSSKKQFTYFGEDYIIWNIFFCQVWLKVREMHRSFNLYWLFFDILNWTKLPLGGKIIADHADYSAERFIIMD